MPINPVDSDVQRKTLHLNGLDFENMEAQPEPVDHAEDKAAQDRFEGDAFYGSSRGIKKMIKADHETDKFNDLTEEERREPVINHERFDEVVPLPPGL